MRISLSKSRSGHHNLRNRSVCFVPRKKIAFCNRRYSVRFKKNIAGCSLANPVLKSSYFYKAKVVVYMVILTIYNYLSKFVSLPGNIRNKKITYRSNDKITCSASFHGFVFNKYVYLSKLGGLLFAPGMNSEASGNSSHDENYWLHMVSLIASPDNPTVSEPEVGL